MSLTETLLEGFAANHATELARALRGLDPERIAEVLAPLSPEASGHLLERVPPVLSARALEHLRPESTTKKLAATSPNAAASILRAMSPAQRGGVLESMSADASGPVTKLLRYSPQTAGALMDPAVLAVGEDTSATEALALLRRHPQHALYYVYLVDDAQRLVGVVNLREIMEARPDQAVGSFATRDVQYLPVRAAAASIVEHPAWDRFHALPVVETGERFVGVLRYESLRLLERRLRTDTGDDPTAATAAAIGEVYGLGLRGIFEWATTAVVGPEDRGGER